MGGDSKLKGIADKTKNSCQACQHLRGLDFGCLPYAYL